MKLALSVDLEPNHDGSLDGVEDAMWWFDEVVPRGTIFATYQIARALPDLLAELADCHEIGVHVHPREFGHEDDQFAELPARRQRAILEETRQALVNACGGSPADYISFRAGRHSASVETFDILHDLGFLIDASVNVRYDSHLPAHIYRKSEPFLLNNGLLEVPTSHVIPPLLSRLGMCLLPRRPITATASTLRTDSWLCDGPMKLRAVMESRLPVVSFYIHPYDATGYHEELSNAGSRFRRRVEEVIPSDREFVTMADLVEVI